ncbi:hypothetical protein I203_107111 [Kwoniella mangroviensis CBS 8507]|uniref:hypothetical protein n=1 Tax=Kwoniella mangroviensis CBS 8507 TaxID=1296122 RepID=UPI00080D64A3|nr:uncharacterized protein I203_01859 [Kwoniella mangroviensis CBS 8507]OCF68476.1 hypothetical protein I203_01859 [Kwoniella mangroviensis CBS 8507]
MSYFISSISRRTHHVDMDEGRIALADQVTRSDNDLWISIVNVVILCLTILGSGMILVSMFVLERIRGRPGTTRTRIVQALIVSDFLLGVVGLISSCLFLSGDGSAIAHGTISCDGLGFLLIAILWTEHGWTLILAFATFMILIYPLHWFTLWMEKRWYFLWAFVWVVSFAVAILGYELFGFYPSGGTCFYGANAGLYSELMQFIPRCVVCIIITVLYARLYVFLKRPDKIRLPGSNSATGGPYETVSSTSNKDKGDFRERFGSLMSNGPFRRKRGSSGEVLSVLPEGQSNISSSSSTDPPPVIKEKEKEPTRRNSGFRRPSFSPTKEVPPWEKLELPAFQVDGERFGGPSPSSIHSGSIWNGWRSGRKRSSTTTASTNVHSPSSRLNSISNSVKHQNQKEENNLRSTPPGLYVPRMPSIPSEDHIDPKDSNPNRDTTQTQSQSQHKRESTDDTYIAKSSIASGSALAGGGEKKRKKSVQLPSSPKSTISSTEYGNGHGSGQSPKIDSRQRPSITISEGIELTPSELQVANQARQDESVPWQTNSSVQPLPKLTLPPRSDNPWSTLDSGVGSGGRRSAPTTPTFSQQKFQLTASSVPGTPGASGPPAQSSRRTSKNDGDRVRTDTQGDDTEDEDEWDLARMLAQPPPGSHTADDRFAPRQSTTNNGESFELVPESMSSYLNRKTALLMLWFPLGYLFLFSVSLIRLIYDFAGNPPIGLRAVSKWMILAQGVLDAIIYGVVEWHTKRVVRKKVRKGTFSPRNAGTPVGSKLGFNGLLKNIGSRVTGTASAGGGGGGGGGMQSKIDSGSGQEMKNPSRSQISSFHEQQPQTQSRNLNTSTGTGTGTGWNQEFSMGSMGSIREGMPTSPNGILMLEEQIHTIRVDDERRGSESPLGGASSPKI